MIAKVEAGEGEHLHRRIPPPQGEYISGLDYRLPGPHGCNRRDSATEGPAAALWRDK